MEKTSFFIFGLIFLAVFSVFGQAVYAQELELEKEEARLLLDSVQQVLIDGWIDLTGSGDFSQPEKQAALFLIRNAIQKKQITFALLDLPRDFVKAGIKLAGSLLLAQEKAVAALLDRIEKETVKKAVDFALDWFLANEIKIASGKLPLTFISYKGNKQEPPLHYLLTYKLLESGARTRAEVAIEFYSPKPVEPKESKGSLGGLLGTEWDFGDWRQAGQEVVEPFILRIKGKAIKQALSYTWSERIIEISFSEPVPEFTEKQEPLIARIPILGGYYKDLKQRFDKLKIILNQWQGLAKLGPGTMAQPPAEQTASLPELTAEEEDLRVLDMDKISIAEKISRETEDKFTELQGEIEQQGIERFLEPAGQTAEQAAGQAALETGGPWLDTGEILAQIQEQLDDIREDIDILSVRATELINNYAPDAGPSAARNDFSRQDNEQKELLSSQEQGFSKEDDKKDDKDDEENGQIGQDEVGQTPQSSSQNNPEQNSPAPYSGGSAGLPGPAPLPSPTKILVTEVQIGNISSANNDFIELYNPSGSTVVLSSFQLKKRSSAGTEYSVRVFPADSSVKPLGYFLWLNTGYASSSQILADAVSTQTLAGNNSIALFDNYDRLLDKVAWGASANPFYEGSPFSRNPETGQTLARKLTADGQAYQDTDNNQEDFELQQPSPGAKNQSPAQLRPDEPAAVNQPPTAQFFFTPANPLIGQEVVFNAASSTDPDGQIISFLWDFGDGVSTSSEQAAATHSFASSTSYIVTLKVIDDLLATSSSAVTTVIVLPFVPPEAPPETPPETPLLTVVINEIAWMGTKAFDEDEWLELYNNTGLAVDLTDWTLKAADGTPSITFSTSSIAAQDYFLLERTDNTAISDIPADLIYSGVLGNKGETLELRNKQGNLIDKVECYENEQGNCLEWLAGKNEKQGEQWTRISMERINPSASSTESNWAGNNIIARNGRDAHNDPINGTPRGKNSVAREETQITLPGSLPFNEFAQLTFTRLGSPYIIANTVSVPEQKTLNIEPGVVLKFKLGAGVDIKGTLKALGQEDKKIIFSSFQEPSFWAGLYFTETSTSSELVWSEVKYASRAPQAGSPPAILVKNASIIFRNSVLSNYTSRGITLINSSSVIENSRFLGAGSLNFSVAIDVDTGQPPLSRGLPLIKDSLFSENQYGILIQFCGRAIVERNNFEANKIPVYTAYNCGAFPYFSANYGGGNQFNAIIIRGRASGSVLWQKNFLPYLIEDFFEVEEGGVLTVEPGVVVKAKPAVEAGRSGGYVRIRGQLSATNASDEPIVFTSLRDDDYGGDTNNDGSATLPGPGNWGGLTFTPLSVIPLGFDFFTESSVLENVIVRYGGYWNPYWPEQGLVSVLNRTVEASRLKAEYGLEAGLHLRNSTSTVPNSIIADSYFEHNQIGLLIEGEAVPQITDYSFSNNQKADIYWPSARPECQNFKADPAIRVECLCCI